MEFLPREIVLDILSRLPVTSLLQFKLVCRAWHNLAQDPLLVGMHLSRVGENDPCLILHCDHPIKNRLFSLELSARNEDNRKVHKIRVPTLPEFHVVGSCKGLLCLCDSLKKTVFYVYNPFTRDYTELPMSTEFPNRSVHRVDFGFGFHQTTNEYKVLKIVYSSIRYIINGFLRGISFARTDVQIFTLGSPGWRILGKIPYSLLDSSNVLLHGRLHWTACSSVSHRRAPLLISFDLEDEKFRVVPKPTCVGFYITPVALQGCLAGAVNCNAGQIDIWVMKEYDVMESWVKEFSIGIHVPRGLEQDVHQSFRRSKFYSYRSSIRVLVLLKNGDILLEYKRRALVCYHPKNGTFKDITFPEMPYLFESVVLEGSLDWIETVNIDA